MHIGLADVKWNGHHTPYVVFLSRYFVERGHEVTFITDAAHPRLDELPESEDIEVRTAEFPKSNRDLSNGLGVSLNEQRIRVHQLRRIFEMTSDVDVLHLLYFDRTQLPMWVASKLTATSLPPTVATLHRDAFTDTEEASGAKRITQAATTFALGACLSAGTVDYLTIHADSIRDRIIENVNAATHENTKTIPAPTPNLDVDASQAEARGKLGLPVNIPVLLFFGELRYEKGPDLLGRAMQGIEAPVTVVFAGSEADFTQRDVDEWKQQIEAPVTVFDRIEFIPEEEVEYYFMAADTLVLPYRRRRGISGPLRRACMANTHIIGNDDSDIGAIIEANGLGQTFDHDSISSLRKTISEFLADPSRYPTDDVAQYGEEQHWTNTGSALEILYTSRT